MTRSVLAMSRSGWELDEDFASQVVYRRDRLGISMDRLNSNGGSIAIGHPFGLTGSRLVGALAYEMQRRRHRYGVVTVCVGRGQGGAALFELAWPRRRAAIALPTAFTMMAPAVVQAGVSMIRGAHIARYGGIRELAADGFGRVNPPMPATRFGLLQVEGGDELAVCRFSDPDLGFHQALDHRQGIDPAHAAFDSLRAFVLAL